MLDELYFVFLKFYGLIEDVRFVHGILEGNVSYFWLLEENFDLFENKLNERGLLLIKRRNFVDLLPNDKELSTDGFMKYGQWTMDNLMSID